MAWAKLDDLYDDNRKIKRAWRQHPRAVGLHAMAITYCARHETDGVVDLEWIEERLPTAKERNSVIAVLIDCGLFEAAPNGDLRVHDYLTYNRSKSAAEVERARKTVRQQRWRERATGKFAGSDASTGTAVDASTDASTDRLVDGSTTPAPTRPDPTHTPLAPEGERAGPAENEGDPSSAGAGRVVTFNRRPVPQRRLDLAVQCVAAVNEHAGTSYRPWTDDGRPTEDLRRAIGFVTAHDDQTPEGIDRLARFVITNPWWKGGDPASVGAIFGPKVAAQNLERLKAHDGIERPADFTKAMAERQARQRARSGRGDAA